MTGAIRNRFILIAFLLVTILTVTGKVEAASLQFDPSSASCEIDATCTIKLVIDAGGDEILATDARIAYDSSVVSVQSITNGDFLTIGKKDFAKNGEIYIAGIVNDPADFKTGSGTLATIVFLGKADGKTTLSFTCKPGETATDSNVAKNDLNATDIIQCSDNTTSVLTIGTGIGSGPTATPTGTQTDTDTDTDETDTTTDETTTQLPKTGVLEELLKYVVPGGILLLFGIAVRLLI